MYSVTEGRCSISGGNYARILTEVVIPLSVDCNGVACCNRDHVNVCRGGGCAVAYGEARCPCQPRRWCKSVSSRHVSKFLRGLLHQLY